MPTSCARRSYLKTFGERSGLEVHIAGHASIESLNSAQKTVLFRVAQESLTNVTKHAQANRVDITLRRFNYAVQMQIKDDGKSFQVHGHRPEKRGKRLGLFGMQERVRLVNGRFTLESAPGEGTTVRVEIPVNAQDPHAGSEKPGLSRGRSAYGQDHSLAG